MIKKKINVNKQIMTIIILYHNLLQDEPNAIITVVMNEYLPNDFLKIQILMSK